MDMGLAEAQITRGSHLLKAIAWFLVFTPTRWLCLGV